MKSLNNFLVDDSEIVGGSTNIGSVKRRSIGKPKRNRSNKLSWVRIF